MAHRAGRLRSDIWNKYGSLKCWGSPHQQLYKEFQKTNPPSYYQLDQKQWQKTFEGVIDGIHAVQEAAKVVVIRKICQIHVNSEFQILNSLASCLFPPKYLTLF
jgi:hypothetical protein